MATTYTENGGGAPDGSDLTFTYSFETIKTTTGGANEEVKVALNGETQATTKYTVNSSPASITFNNTSIDATLQESSGAPKSGVKVKVYRDTAVATPGDLRATFAAGSSIKASDLNKVYEHSLFALQEERERKFTAEDLEDGSVTSSKIKDGTIAAADIANDAIDSQHYAADSIDTEHYAANSVDSTALAADAVTGAKLADNAVDSEHYVDGSIDLAHLSANSVDTSKIVNLTIVNEDISNAANIAQSKLSLDNELTELATMSPGTASALADLTQTEVEILDGVTATTAELNYVDGVTSNVQTQLDAKQTSDAELTELATMHTDTASALADLTQAEVQILDDATVTTAELNKLSGYTGTAADLNELNGLDKQTTITDDDAKFPTSGAVVDYVAAQLQPFGGFEIIANRTSFPNTQPSSGVAISITDANGIVFDSTSTPDTTTGNCKTAGNTNVTVQAAPDALQGKTIGAGVGMLVSSTGSGQNYTFHRLLAKDDDVEQLSQDINDFKNRYRVASSEGALTGTDDEGDLYFDTGANKMYVYDGSSWGEVTSTGDFKYLVLCNQNTNDAATYGSATKFDLKENSITGSLASVTNAAQLMVSVNGVVQKPNTGTSIGSNDGFCMEDGHTIIFGGTIVANSDVFVIQSGSALAINAPGDNTVTGAKIALGSDAAGDIMYYNGTDYVRLGKGTTGHYLKQGGSNAPEWAAVNQYSTPLTTRGDILFRDASGDQRLAKGTDGQFLKIGANDPVWADIPPGTPTTTRGDIIYRGASADERLAKGTSGQYLKIGANAPEWADVIGAVADGCIYENDLTISNNHTIAATKGAHSVGPITVNATVTVNGNWVVS